MKIFLSTFIICLFAYGLRCQSFEVVDNNRTHIGTIGQTINAPIRIKNLTDQPIQIIIKRLDKVIGTSQKNYFCWGEECYDENVNELPLSKRIAPGETSMKFESILETGLVAGISSDKYLVYNRDNPSESVEYEVNYTVNEDRGKNAIFSTEDMRINEVYPNPVTAFAIIDYNINNKEVEAKIMLHNVLGSVVGEYDLSFLETKLKIDTKNLNPGVYFYTLYLDNDGIITKKLIIRK